MDQAVEVLSKSDSGNTMLVFLVGIAFTFWLIDKVAFYVSKAKNDIPISHARMGAADRLVKVVDDQTSVLHDLTTALHGLNSIMARIEDRTEKDLGKLRTDMRDAHDKLDEALHRMGKLDCSMRNGG